MKGSVRYAAAGGVVIDGEQMLVLDRPARGEMRLPKGHIEEDESALEAALRETAEESGYDDLAVVADLGEQVTEFDHEGRHIVRTEHYFLLRLLSDHQAPRTPNDEAQFRVCWLPLEVALEELTYAAEQAVARRAIQALGNL